MRRLLPLSALLMLIVNTACTTQGLKQIHTKSYGNIWCGQTTLAAMLKNDSMGWLREGTNNYSATTQPAMSKLLEFRKGLQVEVYAATWCSDTRLLLPQLARVLLHTNIKLAEVKVTLLNTRKKLPGHLLRPRGIKKVPTIKLYFGGECMGAIVETLPPGKNMEQALFDLLQIGLRM